MLQPLINQSSMEVEYPSPDTAPKGLYWLSRLFTLLKTSFLQAPGAACSAAELEEVLAIQAQLEEAWEFPGIGPTQFVDLNVTKNWLRAIIWRHSFPGFARSQQIQEPTLSPEYPLTIVKDTVALLANADEHAIRAHGYGMVMRTPSLNQKQ